MQEQDTSRIDINLEDLGTYVIFSKIAWFMAERPLAALQTTTGSKIQEERALPASWDSIHAAEDSEYPLCTNNSTIKAVGPVSENQKGYFWHRSY